MNNYQKLDWISFAIQEAINGNKGELMQALNFVEELRDPRPEEMETPKAIEWELELCMFGDGGETLSPTMEEADSWEVALHLRLEHTGQIEILYEQEFNSQGAADDQFALMEGLFPDASHNVQPDH
tara:strand:+ start:153 stop:530 length:378 start_codon:yes stop_codon:yes gene_type:complete